MRYLFRLQFIITFTILTVCCTLTSNAQDVKSSAQINFIENSWGEALKQAAAKNKYIFVDAYASWCGPCKLLKATTFKDGKVARFYNSNFINVAMDMEKGDGPQLAAKWGLQAYPTMIIFDPKGKPVYGTVGYIKADDLIKFGVKGLNK
ncbi:thioredoxin family protein [Mucilaginibacter dorajii]|uniref:Thioredoxin domain-containing protein n=1 Tax=Mucilaginibacter dorajii TaxID=692994 RepID=A0ABP7PPT2_9SPHI|nr:thioredoxin family protein [Mucilaginibacter dorajii]MCS3736944.1 thiol:disulfide interchange protein [Mucilaginibacter dorajii]